LSASAENAGKSPTSSISKPSKAMPGSEKEKENDKEEKHMYSLKENKHKQTNNQTRTMFTNIPKYFPLYPNAITFRSQSI
jgi:hypothetical protein